jgi:putative ABC transport system substrate-binding protein
VKRREFITLLGGAASWPLAAGAQQPAMPVIGFLGSELPDLYVGRLRAFRQGLNEASFVEGRNVAIEYRWAEGRNDRLPGLADDLVRRRVTVMVATSTPAVLAAKAATTTIPIAFLTGTDPVAMGVVASLNRPGGNMTGVSNLSTAMGAKQLELLHAVVPSATVIALLVNPTDPIIVETLSKDLQTAARAIQREILVVSASTEREIDTAFTTLVQRKVGALVVGNDPFFNARPDQLVALAARHAVPAIYPYREFVAAGGLMSYGSSLADAYRLVGVYAGRILKGEKPADLPVQQSTKVELVLNLKTAKALGITLPISLLGRADEVVE